MRLDDSILRLVIAGVWIFSSEFGGLRGHGQGTETSWYILCLPIERGLAHMQGPHGLNRRDFTSVPLADHTIKVR